MSEDKKKRTAALAQFEGVDERVKMLIYFSMQGLCPFCLADIERGDAEYRAVHRSLRGENFEKWLATERAKDLEDGIDSKTGHAIDCPLPDGIR